MLILTHITVPILSSVVISNEDNTSSSGCSVFNDQQYSLEDYNGLWITDRMNALNFRHRMSEPGYSSSWHVAGDPTLIIIRAGILRIGLRNGKSRDFKAGDQFIAMDRLQEGETFDDQVHGHTAELIGDQTLFAVHIKLASI
ncbi:hypothetical protein [Psychromonas algicola]|uniref:hypothetical protein n=1 Tax=Psychromonas algicola TaxID=2555642 RepID=UPI00403E73E4